MKHSEEEKKAFIRGWIAKHKLLMDFVKGVDASLYHGSDLEDKEIMEHYIEVFKLIKKEAHRILQAAEKETADKADRD